MALCVIGLYDSHHNISIQLYYYFELGPSPALQAAGPMQLYELSNIIIKMMAPESTD
jgi:hypothetical protein